MHFTKLVLTAYMTGQASVAPKTDINESRVNPFNTAEYVAIMWELIL